MLAFIKTARVLNKHQLAFQENCNTEAAVMNLLSEINKESDKGNYVVALYLRIKKGLRS